MKDLLLDLLRAESPMNMTLDRGTPMAGVFAGTQYTTAIVSFFDSQSTEVVKLIANHST